MVALSGLGGALAVIFMRCPVPGAYPACLFHSLTGMYCPGCGSLRATYQLLHGDLAAALGLNVLLVAVLPFLCYMPASWLRMMLTGRGFPELAPPTGITWSLLGVIIAFWVARNVPVHPFAWLAP